jgi:hypothetical protein
MPKRGTNGSSGVLKCVASGFFTFFKKKKNGKAKPNVQRLAIITIEKCQPFTTAPEVNPQKKTTASNNNAGRRELESD